MKYLLDNPDISFFQYLNALYPKQIRAKDLKNNIHQVIETKDWLWETFVVFNLSRCQYDLFETFPIITKYSPTPSTEFTPINFNNDKSRDNN